MSSKPLMGCLGFTVGIFAATGIGVALGRETSEDDLTLLLAIILGVLGIGAGLGIAERRRHRNTLAARANLVVVFGRWLTDIDGQRQAEADNRYRRPPLPDGTRRANHETVLGSAALHTQSQWTPALLHLDADGYWFEFPDGHALPPGAETGPQARFVLEGLEILHQHGRFHLNAAAVAALGDGRKAAEIRSEGGDLLFTDPPPIQ